jgi:hypothetical protein
MLSAAMTRQSHDRKDGFSLQYGGNADFQFDSKTFAYNLRQGTILSE